MLKRLKRRSNVQHSDPITSGRTNLRLALKQQKEMLFVISRRKYFCTQYDRSPDPNSTEACRGEPAFHSSIVYRILKRSIWSGTTVEASSCNMDYNRVLPVAGNYFFITTSTAEYRLVWRGVIYRGRRDERILRHYGIWVGVLFRHIGCLGHRIDVERFAIHDIRV